MIVTERTYVVLGMHRSSTSITSRGLSLILGPGSMGRPPEDDGYHEDLEFVALNDDILAAAGGSWDKPPPDGKILEQRPAFLERIQALINARNERFRFWGWKDPRTALTINLYHPYLIRPHYVCCFRSAEDVASSLLRVGHGLRYIDAYRLAREYHRRIHQFMSETFVSI